MLLFFFFEGNNIIEPRKKHSDAFHYTGCVEGILTMVYYKLESLHNWVGFHPPSTLNNRLGPFFIAQVESHLRYSLDDLSEQMEGSW